MSGVGEDVESYRLSHSSQKLDVFRDLVAGTAAGLAICLTGHPFDTCKVRLQTSTQFKGGVDVMLHTIRQEGAISLYKGLSGPLASVPVINALVFSSYEFAKRIVQQSNVDDITRSNELTMNQIAVCGGFSGLVNSIVACPVELIKNKLQVQYEATKAGRQFAGPVDCVRQTLQTQGVRGMYRGMVATIAREIPAYTGQFYTYELCKAATIRYLYADTPTIDGQPPQLGTLPQLICGGMGGLGCWLASYPQDLVKSILQTEQLTGRSKYRSYGDGGFIDCFATIYRKGGFISLWRGFGPCAARAFVANSFGFLTYEWTLEHLKQVI